MDILIWTVVIVVAWLGGFTVGIDLGKRGSDDGSGSHGGD